MNRAFVAGSNGSKSHNPLKYAEDDAREIARCLSSRRCNFSVEMPGAESSIADFRALLYSVAEQCIESDTFICFFSGHGFLDKGELFLVWHDTDVARPLATALPASACMEAMKHCRANNKLLILDCCRAGASVDGFKDISDDRVEDVIPSENYRVLMASDRFSSARELDSLRGGFLSKALAAALSDSYYSVIGSDRRLSFDDVKRWLDQQASNHNKSYGPEFAVKTPYSFGHTVGEFYFDVPLAEQWQPEELIISFREEDHEFVLLPFQFIGKVEPSAIWLGKYPVLNREYRFYISRYGFSDPYGEQFQNGWWQPGFWPWSDDRFDDPDQPVVCVSLDEAWAYANWFYDECLDHGKYYPWLESESHTYQPMTFGSVCIPTPGLWDLVMFGTEYPSRNPKAWLGSNVVAHGISEAPMRIDRGGGRTNQLGISDMVGNVWEWCEYADEHNVRAPSITRRFPEEGVDGRSAELRGGSFLDDLRLTSPFVKVSELEKGRTTRHSDLGFRIALMSPISSMSGDLRGRIEDYDVYVSDTPLTGPAQLG